MATVEAIAEPAKLTTARHGRSLQLDVLRGVAILLVLVNHSQFRTDSHGAFARVIRTIADGGGSGVDLFFVLSGFLVGGLLFKELLKRGRLDVPRFLVRRMLKIWPAYFVFLGYFALKLLHRKTGLGTTFHILLPNLLQIQNYWPGPAGHTWSLAVEEHFYLILPLALWLATRHRRGKLLSIPQVLWMSAGVFVVCQGFRIWNLTRPWTLESHFLPTHLRADSLFTGVFLAYLYHFHPAGLESITRYRRTLLILGLLLVSPVFVMGRSSAFISAFGPTVTEFGYACMLLAVLDLAPAEGILGKLFNSPLAKLVAWIGVYSYSIYLWNDNLVQDPLFYQELHYHFFARFPGELGYFLYLAVYVTLAVLVGALLSKMIEQPFLVLRDRLYPGRADALHETVSAPNP